MRTFKLKKVAGLMAVAAAIFVAQPASAVVDLVGTVEPGHPVSDEILFVNELLALAGSGSTTVPEPPPNSPNGDVLVTAVSSTDYSAYAPVTFGEKVDISTATSVSGYAFVLAKFGENSRVWFVPAGETLNLPATLGGHGLSHWTGFTAVPEPTTFIAGALLLLPFGVSALRVMRKNKA